MRSEGYGRRTVADTCDSLLMFSASPFKFKTTSLQIHFNLALCRPTHSKKSLVSWEQKKGMFAKYEQKVYE